MKLNLSNIFLFFSIIFFGYVFYRAELNYSGLMNDYYFKYYIIGLSLIFISLLSYFISNPIKIKIAKLLILFIVSCYIVEGVLTFKLINSINNQKIKLANKIKDSKNFDKRSIYEAYIDLKKVNEKLVYYNTPKTFLNDSDLNILPLSVMSNTEYFTYEKEHGHYPDFKTDSYGFRNSNSEWDKEIIDLFLIGDSYLMTGSLKTSIAENLRKKLKNNNGILNLSQGSFGTLYEYAILKEYLPIVKAKKVVLFYYEANDLTNLVDELKNEKLLNYINDENYTQNLYLNQNIVDKMYIKKIKSIDYIKDDYHSNNSYVQNLEDKKNNNWKFFLKLYKIRKFIFNQSSHKPIKEFEKIINLMNKFSEQNGAKFYIVYVPDINRYIDGGSNVKDSSKYYENVIQIFKNLKIEYIDLHTELFLKVKNPLIYFPFEFIGHGNELQFSTVAQLIYKKLY